jgi:hypothetical protein
LRGQRRDLKETRRSEEIAKGIKKRFEGGNEETKVKFEVRGPRREI